MRILKLLIKKITSHPRFRMLIGWVLTDYIKLVYKTGRWEFVGYDNIETYFTDNKPMITSAWHGRLMMMPYAWKDNENLHVLVSMHRDGQLIGDILKEFDMKIIDGSTSRGGARAVRKIIKLLREGFSIGLTPDGPRGPRMRMGNSLLYFARTSGAPVIPVAFSAKWAFQLKSWDSFLFVLPFTKGVFVIGEPMEVPKWTDDEEMERLRGVFEERMNFITAEADRKMGRKPTKPADFPLMSDEAKNNRDKQNQSVSDGGIADDTDVADVTTGEQTEIEGDEKRNEEAE
ncbi:MAG: lysophospholipid acyltransferase family protein [Alphaproteobacteria bacterium]|nr:lysophospholipid acyltransferase family protein [Alphaproteobacteria bacterium]